jgi:hypothetical protein
VAPENQKQGLITKIAPFTYDTWKKGGVAFVYGTPNERWGSMLAKLGFQTLFPLERLARPLRPEAILARRSGLTPLSRLSMLGRWAGAFWNRRLHPEGVVVREVAEAGPGFDRIWSTVGPHFPFCLVRDRGFVKWRFFEAPLLKYRVLVAEREGEPVGYAAFGVKDGPAALDGTLSELFVAPEDLASASALLLQVLRCLAELGVETLFTLAVPGHFLHSFLRSAGFLPRRGRWDVVLSPFDAQLPMEDLKDPRNWYYAGGDTDSV